MNALLIVVSSYKYFDVNQRENIDNLKVNLCMINDK